MERYLVASRAQALVCVHCGCLKRCHVFQKSVVQAVLDATHERPWLWAVIIVVVLLPIVLLIAYCCMPGSSKVTHLSLSHPCDSRLCCTWQGYVWQFLMTHSWLLCGIVVVLLVIYAIRHQMQVTGAGHAPPPRVWTSQFLLVWLRFALPELQCFSDVPVVVWPCLHL